MFAHFYQNNIIKKPKAILAILIFFLLIFGYYTKDFKLDASADTLLIENDPDLEYLREVSSKFGAKEFLILTYTPREKLITDSSINNLLSLKYKIQSLEWVHSVVTLLDIPLLNSTDETLSDKLKNFSTLSGAKR